jgi:hypothetical protein
LTGLSAGEARRGRDLLSRVLDADLASGTDHVAVDQPHLRLLARVEIQMVDPSHVERRASPDQARRTISIVCRAQHYVAIPHGRPQISNLKLLPLSALAVQLGFVFQSAAVVPSFRPGLFCTTSPPATRCLALDLSISAAGHDRVESTTTGLQ